MAPRPHPTLARGAAASLWLAAMVASCASDDDGETCDAFHTCEAAGDTCATDVERCTCEVGSGLAWACEPLVCPVEPAVEGTPCGPVGLRCDTGFESPGTMCVGPEGRWAICRYYHQGDERNGCPLAPPTVGAPCCQALPGGGPTPGCLYGDTVYDCVGDHWRVVTASTASPPPSP